VLEERGQRSDFDGHPDVSYYAGYTTSDAFGCIPRLKKRVECILSDVLKKERAKTGVEVAFGWVKERLQDSFSIWMKLSAKWDSLRPRIYLGVLSVRERCLTTFQEKPIGGLVKK